MDERYIAIYKHAYYVFMTYTCVGAFLALIGILVMMYMPNDDNDIEIDQIKNTINSGPKALLVVFCMITFCYPIFLGNAIFGKKGN